MNSLLRRCLSTLSGLIFLVALLLAWQLLDYARLARQARQLTIARSNAVAPELPTAATMLARAQVLLRRNDDRAAEAALELYRAVEAEGSEDLRRIARFDTANLYMRQALVQTDRGERGRAIPLIELAKGIYRGLLQEQPHDWDLRYNLERAVRLLPEDDPEATELVQEAPENAERAPTTLRGTSMGMP